MNGPIQEDITVVYTYTPSIGAPQYIRHILTDIKGEINSNTIILGDFNTPLSSMNRSSRQKINKETQALNDTLDQLDLIDIYRTFHPKAAEYTFFSCAHGTSSKIEHVLGHKVSFGKLKKIEIIRDFPSGPVVKNPPSNAGDMSSIPGWGTKIPHAAGQLGLQATTTELLCPNERAHMLQTTGPMHSGACTLHLQNPHALEPTHHS